MKTSPWTRIEDKAPPKGTEQRAPADEDDRALPVPVLAQADALDAGAGDPTGAAMRRWLKRAVVAAALLGLLLAWVLHSIEREYERDACWDGVWVVTNGEAACWGRGRNGGLSIYEAQAAEERRAAARWERRLWKAFDDALTPASARE